MPVLFQITQLHLKQFLANLGAIAIIKMSVCLSVCLSARPSVNNLTHLAPDETGKGRGTYKVYQYYPLGL